MLRAGIDERGIGSDITVEMEHKETGCQQREGPILCINDEHVLQVPQGDDHEAGAGQAGCLLH